MENIEFNIEDVMTEVKKLRKFFISEHDFQFIIGVAIRKLYKNAQVVMEYKYPDEALDQNVTRQYIDIMVIINDKLYPIELKYNYKACHIPITEKLEYKLSDRSCRTTHRENYCKDIMRLLDLRKSKFQFEKGYAIMLTNYKEFRYQKRHQDKWLLYEENIKNGVNEINESKEGYDKKMYDMKWDSYDSQNEFSYLITTINKIK